MAMLRGIITEIRWYTDMLIYSETSEMFQFISHATFPFRWTRPPYYHTCTVNVRPQTIEYEYHRLLMTSISCCELSARQMNITLWCHPIFILSYNWMQCRYYKLNLIEVPRVEGMWSQQWLLQHNFIIRRDIALGTSLSKAEEVRRQASSIKSYTRNRCLFSF